MSVLMPKDPFGSPFHGVHDWRVPNWIDVQDEASVLLPQLDRRTNHLQYNCTEYLDLRLPVP